MSEIDHIVSVLKEGGTILYPTDTTWGLGCDATSSQAVAELFKIKIPTPELPTIILVDSLMMLHRHVEEVHPRVETLLSYHQRPLTVVYDKGRLLASELLGEGGSVAIRMTLDPFCKEIISELGKPIVATAATYGDFGYPYRFEDVAMDMVKNVDYVVRYKQDQVSLEDPSVIVRLTERAELDFIRE
ncbi:MAG: translation factor Sua5 [Saprospiraceae bacterium]|nr:translation factor Sua5 [Saprospiraceae bacterium]